MEISTSQNLTMKPYLLLFSPLYDPEHRQVSLYEKEKPDHFHVYGADRCSYYSNEAYYPTRQLNHHHFFGNGMIISGNP